MRDRKSDDFFVLSLGKRLFTRVMEMGKDKHKEDLRFIQFYYYENFRNQESYDALGVELKYLREYRKYVKIDKGDIISYCKISDLVYGFGNIVVWTDAKFRRRGYARELLLRVIERCKLEGIEPIYIVDCNNVASIELACSVGFEIVQTEIVGCESIEYKE